MGERYIGSRRLISKQRVLKILEVVSQNLPLPSKEAMKRGREVLLDAVEKYHNDFPPGKRPRT